ncbi:MAG: nucleotidyltransferase family protein [Muribaculaceae bacterium]|nr:nucleotidyltransferase family protein [Muribaculaceae bacterium]
MSSDPLSLPTVCQCLELIRSALWQTAPMWKPFTDTCPKWDHISKMAMEQTVGPLVVESALRLPEHLRPPKEWVRKACAMVERNRRTHKLMDSTVAEAFSTFREADLSPVLLKGQAYARFYPDPTLRQCGDIDIYVGGEQYRQAYEVAVRSGWECDDEFLPDAKHYRCTIRGVKTELHMAAARLVPETADRRFVRWSLAHLDGSHGCATVGGEAVPVPTPLFDVVFVFTHLLHHYLSGGIGLRQVCDWVMLLHIHAGIIDHRELRQRLEDFGLLRSWQIFTPLAVDILGLPRTECPLYSPRYLENAKTILSFIIREGNFGQYVSLFPCSPRGYLLRKIYSYWCYSRRIYSKLHTDPAMIIRHHLCFTGSGLLRIFRDLTGRLR